MRTNFSAAFWTFRNFWRQFRENCGAIWRQKWEPCSASERTILSEKNALKTASKSTHKSSHNTCFNYVPHAQADQPWHTKKHQFSLLQLARVVRSPQTLHADRERRDNSKVCNHFFDPTHRFSCRGENADFWPLTHWVNLIGPYRQVAMATCR